jgi:hypothetical protein
MVQHLLSRYRHWRKQQRNLYNALYGTWINTPTAGKEAPEGRADGSFKIRELLWLS